MATEKREVWWISPNPEKCDCCGGRIDKEFVDGAVRKAGGRWGIMCYPNCFTLDGMGLGQGRGQRYRRQQNDRFLKVEG